MTVILNETFKVTVDYLKQLKHDSLHFYDIKAYALILEI